MQHLDDGYLQSWLDRDRSGITPAEAAEVEAHVADCEVCAARLAELEETSERSRSLLAVATPSPDPAPDFQDVVRRSRRRRSVGGRRGRGWMAAGWAASIVAAAGLGWMSHELLRPGTDPTPAGEAEATVAASDLPAARAEPDREATREATDGATEAPATEQAAAGEETRAATEQARAGAPPQDPEDPDPEDPDPGITIAPTTFGDPAPTADIAGRPGSLLVQGRVRGDDGRPLAAAQVTIPGASTGAMTAEDGSFTLFLPADSVPADSTRPIALTATRLGFRSAIREIDPGAGDTLSVDFRLEEAAVAMDEIVVGGAARADRAPAPAAEADPAREAWAPATRGEAESGVGFELLTLPDLPVLEIELGEVAGAVAVRVRQELGSGATLTLVQRRAEGPEWEPTLPEGQAAVTIEEGGVRVTGAAPMEGDSLRAVLERLR